MNENDLPEALKAENLKRQEEHSLFKDCNRHLLFNLLIGAANLWAALVFHSWISWTIVVIYGLFTIGWAYTARRIWKRKAI